MADTDGDDQTQLNVAADAPAGGDVAGEMDINEALRRVLKAAIVADGIVRGLREAAKALDKRKAHLCILATNCQEPLYIKLVEALCSEHNIPLLKVDDNKKLGEWSGLCKIDQKGNARKVVGCTCVVITSWGEENEGHFFLKDYIKKNKK